MTTSFHEFRHATGGDHIDWHIDRALTNTIEAHAALAGALTYSDGSPRTDNAAELVASLDALTDVIIDLAALARNVASPPRIEIQPPDNHPRGLTEERRERIRRANPSPAVDFGPAFDSDAIIRDIAAAGVYPQNTEQGGSEPTVDLEPPVWDYRAFEDAIDTLRYAIANQWGNDNDFIRDRWLRDEIRTRARAAGVSPTTVAQKAAELVAGGYSPNVSIVDAARLVAREAEERAR